MKKEPVPVANRNLSWLCREHYNGIKVVCSVRRAIRCNVSNEKIVAYIQEEFASHLDQHFKEEELWLFPKLPSTNVLRMQAEKQHESLRKMAANTSLLAEEFADLLEEHIRFEERTLFPVFRGIVDDEHHSCLSS